MNLKLTGDGRPGTGGWGLGFGGWGLGVGGLDLVALGFNPRWWGSGGLPTPVSEGMPTLLV
ncbi:MAG: hypothetical protein Q7U53_07470 [Anaerolineaceae bacterium]|nr:hypothetical protein [Anaerolineaceae bacterium]